MTLCFLAINKGEACSGGNPDASDYCWKYDPYESMNLPPCNGCDTLHTYFLRRLANASKNTDPVFGVLRRPDQPWPAECDGEYYDYCAQTAELPDTGGANGGPGMARPGGSNDRQSSYPAGDFYACSTAECLEPAFQKIASKIKYRLSD